MASKMNLSFFNAYLELDKVCAERFEISKNGVSTYINRLAHLRFAPERSEILPRLIKYRNYRNTIAHEVDAFTELGEINKDDIKWLNNFAKSVASKRDPVSRYERRAQRYAIWRKVRIILIALGAVGVIVVGIMLYNLISGLG